MREGKEEEYEGGGEKGKYKGEGRGRSERQLSKSLYFKKITQTAVMNIVFQCIFIELDVSYASQHTFSKVTVTIFETYIYIIKQ